MIIKKPYLIFLKHFRLLNLLLFLLIIYLINNDNTILKFLNNYILINNTKISIINNINSLILVGIPIVICFFSIISIGIMFKKNKPVKLYFFIVFSFIAIIVINVYLISFTNTISKQIVSISYIKLARDLKLISIILEYVSCIILFVRIIGLNLKKFDFSSDTLKFDLDNEDFDDVEINFKIDNDKIKKRRKKRLENIRYIYLENKFKFNSIVLIFFIFLIAGISIIYINKEQSYKKEGIDYSTNSLTVMVNSSYYSSKDYFNNKITDNTIIIVDVNLKGESKILLSEFSLESNGMIFKPIEDYYNNYLDLGVGYKENFNSQTDNYIIAFEVPKKYVKSNFIFSVSNIKIKLNLVDLDNISDEIYSFNLKEKAKINDSYFIINEFEVKKEFLINYNYCYKNDDCIASVEHLKASINENFDKAVLRLNVDSNVDFANYFKNFVYIIYRVNGTEYSQKGDFEILKSKKSKLTDIYIGVDENLLNADYIKLLFNVRNIKIEYLLRSTS